MINLSADAMEVLEKVMNAEKDFAVLLKGLSIGGSGIVAVPDSSMITIHTQLLLHVIANLIEAQTEIGMLKGQIARLRVNLKGHHHVDKIYPGNITKYGGDAVIMENE